MQCTKENFIHQQQIEGVLNKNHYGEDKLALYSITYLLLLRPDAVSWRCWALPRLPPLPEGAYYQRQQWTRTLNEIDQLHVTIPYLHVWVHLHTFFAHAKYPW